MYGSGCRVVVSRELGTAGTRVPASVPSRGDKGGRQVPRFVSMGNRSPLTPDGDNDLAALPDPGCDAAEADLTWRRARQWNGS